MATTSQVTAAIARVLAVPFGRLRWAAEQMSRAGLLPHAQGRVVDLNPREIAVLIIAALLGEEGVRPQFVAEFAGLSSRGGTLADSVAHHLAHPDTFVRLHVDAAGSATLVTAHATQHFGEPDISAISRLSVIDGDAFRRLADAIQNAPRLRAGRPPKNRNQT